MKCVAPSAMRMSMNPPPPRLPACGCTTANANPTATAASTALPPACMISTPAWEANSCTLTTIPCAACTGCVEDAANGAVAMSASNKINDFCGDRMRFERPQTIQERTLRLADGGEQSQIAPGMVYRHLFQLWRKSPAVPDFR